MRKIVIIANGSMNNAAFHKEVLDDADIIICADGGANHAERLEIIPDYVIVDMDSIKDLLHDLEQNDKTKVIVDPDQDRTAIPVTNVKGLTYEGLKWGLTNVTVDLGWLGVRNRMIDSEASISLKEGKVFVVI